jgi:MinD superfamily P-loop ATPase
VATDACTCCGTCAKVCPAGNIVVNEGGVTFKESCEVCYACLHACPAHALHLRKERSAARFRNEHVSLADLIEANRYQ